MLRSLAVFGTHRVLERGRVRVLPPRPLRKLNSSGGANLVHHSLRVDRATKSKGRQKRLRWEPLRAPLHALLQNLSNRRGVVDQGARTCIRALVVDTRTVRHLVEPNSELRVPHKEVGAEERRTQGLGQVLRHGHHPAHVPQEQSDRHVEARVAPAMFMQRLPIVLVAERSLLQWPSHEPGVAFRSHAAPPPDADPNSSPEGGDPQLQGHWKTHRGLVLRLRHVTWHHRLQGLALQLAGLFVEELLNVRLDGVDSGSPLVLGDS
mmetsp:Transcript_50358/g.133725  ORF Transcript_50358/g.133725 Transcript_50358/m.133725 type:complete len:264 (+) Transcript_50358:567-1358(+)